MSDPSKPDKETTSLQVLSDEGGVTVASVSGKANPVVMFDDDLAAKLLQHWRVASEQAAQLQTDHRADAVLKLCEAVGKVMEQYVATRNKYFGGQKVGDRDGVLAELKLLTDKLKELQPPSVDLRTVDFTCSFCGRDRYQVQRMIQGTASVICGDCIKDCWELLGDEQPHS